LFHKKVEPGVIGGMVIKTGDKTIDGSLWGELSGQINEMMRREVK
jgi:F0F1-type ATP synthase delta subunit